MKFTSKERKLVSSQKTMAIELGLADQKKAIELLYSQYSNPIQTCVQELVSNAFDAMQTANRSHLPIKITLPNELNEFYFSVRDFGNSMDDDTIKNVYMRVNASTKSNDNKAIGGFGIGSKTPWAYTDTFILKTFLNGLETQYALVKGRSSVSIVYQGETTQENGTEVIFKTKEKDKQDFENAVRRISLCAKTKPLVNTSKSLSFAKEDKFSNSVSLVQSDLLERTIYLNIGGVLYKYPTRLLDNNDKPWLVGTIDYNILGYIKHSLVITLPIGSVMPLQTREGLFTGGEEGQQNKAVLKKVFNHTLKVIESTIEAREKMVISPKKAIEFFINGLISSNKVFKFGNLEVSSSTIILNKGNFITDLSRKKSRGWGKAANVKKLNLSYINLKDLDNQIYFSELSSNKARLSNRFYDMTSHRDVIVLEKHLFQDAELYELLKDLTNAVNIETIEVKKTVSKNKGTKKDLTKVVYYDAWGTRLGTLDLDKSNHDRIVIVSKDRGVKYGLDAYKALGYKVFFVANSNVKKVLEHENYFSEEEAIDLEKLAMILAHSKANNILNRRELERNNLDFLKTKVSSSKQNLFAEPNSYRSLNWDLQKLLEERYGKSIDRVVKKMVKARVRVVNIADSVPLVQHIERPKWLKGQAKKDLENYIVNNIGG